MFSCCFARESVTEKRWLGNSCLRQFHFASITPLLATAPLKFFPKQLLYKIEQEARQRRIIAQRTMQIPAGGISRIVSQDFC